MIEEFGPALGSPYTKALKDGLFEIRAKGKEGIGRSFFCTAIRKRGDYFTFICEKITKNSQKRN